MSDWAEIIYERLRRHAEEKAVEWRDDEVKSFIRMCLADGGIPMFKDKYAGKRFEVDGKPAVLAICYGGRGNAPNHQWFRDVPERDIEIIERETGEWREFLTREDEREENKLSERIKMEKKLAELEHAKSFEEWFKILKQNPDLFDEWIEYEVKKTTTNPEEMIAIKNRAYNGILNNQNNPEAQVFYLTTLLSFKDYIKPYFDKTEIEDIRDAIEKNMTFIKKKYPHIYEDAILFLYS